MNLSQDQIYEINCRTGNCSYDEPNFKRSQFNIQLQDGTVIPAGINPGQAATIVLAGKGNTNPQVVGRNEPGGQAIADQFAGQNEYTPAMQQADINTSLNPQQQAQYSALTTAGASPSVASNAAFQIPTPGNFAPSGTIAPETLSQISGPVQTGGGTVQGTAQTQNNAPQTGALQGASNTSSGFAGQTGGGGFNSMAGTIAPTAPSLPSFSSQGTTAPSIANTADQYLQSYLNSLQSTPQETAYQQQLQQLQSQANMLGLGQQQTFNALDMQPIARPFITGQQTAVAKDYALQQQTNQAQQLTVTQQLALEQAKRQGAIDVNKATLDYASGKDTRADQMAQFNADQNFQMQMQNLQNQYNAAQDKYKLDYGQYSQDLQNQFTAEQQRLQNEFTVSQNKESPTETTKLDTSVVEVGGRKLLINNQTGQTISDLGDAPRSDDDPFTNYTAKQEAARKAAQTKLGTFMKSKTGSDGYVSPEDYRSARSAWVQDGYSAADFDKIFSGYVNPADPQDYGVNFQTKTSSNQ